MRLAWRILLGYALVVVLGLVFIRNIFMDEVKPGVRQTMEDTLIDTAQVLARLAAADLRRGQVDRGDFAAALRDLDRQALDASVWRRRKTHVNYRVYVTDARGVVVFDSTGQAVGQDYSRWNDVLLTLKGKYGARSSRSDPTDEGSSVMHVAAPIVDGGRIIGVLTVAKPNRAVAPIIESGQHKILVAGLWWLGLSLLIGLAVAAWITGSLQQLLRYAERVGRGEKAEPPRFGGSELGTLSAALAQMREKLEGKQYVERYVHTLTHEMKSPLTAIGGSAELLGEELPPEQRQRFAAHAREQAERLHQLVERMLGLASVESRQRLELPAQVDLDAVVAQVLAERETALAARQLAVQVQSDHGAIVLSDRFLLAQAVANLLDNAIAFSPDGARIDVTLGGDAKMVTLTVADQGAGIADYALERVFERFFSLPRPSSGKKSTGLGLPFVREVAQLHQGSATLANRPEGGAMATLCLSRAPDRA